LTHKPLTFYNRKSGASRVSNMDDSLIAEAVSVISALPVVPRLFGFVSSPQTSSEVAHVPASRVPPKRGFLRPSSFVVICGCSPMSETMGLVCPQVLSVEQSPSTDLVVLDQHGVQHKGEFRVQHVEESKIVQCAMEIGPLLGIS